MKTRDTMKISHPQKATGCLCPTRAPVWAFSPPLAPLPDRACHVPSPASHTRTSPSRQIRGSASRLPKLGPEGAVRRAQQLAGSPLRPGAADPTQPCSTAPSFPPGNNGVLWLHGITESRNGLGWKGP